MFPVKTRYLEPRVGRPAGGGRCSGDASRASPRKAGSALVFLPGVGEIRRVEERLGQLGADIDIAPLYGDLSSAEQEPRISPAPAGRA
jgi:ATP-dependent helicase HrpB